MDRSVAVSLVVCHILVALLSIVSGQSSSNLTLTVDNVPVNLPNSGRTFLNRLNVQVNSAWSKFKCQFYTKAAVPVSKLLNVKIPASLEIPNITNCGQLNLIVVKQLNTTLATVGPSLTSQQVATSATTISGGNETVTTVASNEITTNQTTTNESTTTSASTTVESTTETTTTTVVSSSESSTGQSESTSITSSVAPSSSESAPEVSTSPVSTSPVSSTESTGKPVVGAK